MTDSKKNISVYDCEKITEAIDELRQACVDREDSIVPSRKFVLDLLCGAAIHHEACGVIERSWED